MSAVLDPPASSSAPSSAEGTGAPVKPLPIDAAKLCELADELPTPFHIYDEAGIRANARRLNAAFAWNPGFREYFAVKATPTPGILELFRDENCGMDCSSAAELMLCDRIGVTGERIMFTSNNTPAVEFRRAKELGAILNLDDLTHLPYVAEEAGGLPETLCFRFNPGPLRGGNAIIGKPEDAKYGFTREQLFDGYRQAQAGGVKRFGLHAMVASNELDPQFFVDTARMLFALAVEVHEATGVRIEFVNLGGGIGIPYRPGQEAVSYEQVSEGTKAAYDEIVLPAGLDPLAVYMENGRCMTGPYGVLVTKAVHRKEIYKRYVGVDACMANLMRPGMYGAYHHVSVLGRGGEKVNAPSAGPVDVVGSLCENNDKFAIDRELPAVERGDVLAIHDAGAHGHSMGFQYNGKLRSAEYLLKEDGSVEQIRRAETYDDLFATLNV
ncbi:diaminopimelate decarboxylase [Alienimonas californiensis]|uniref:Diaminopimelate decarboxylase n=1 Tax=Alienimonas californiensis TaxID=2527989 RepID=A0A517PCQ0_9PLAN|nr:diaminopimelate decarboxylase [Alienimonas californiensis]QDT17145.1 Diaminopimelate decarboxylase [Alienimonas californiensis]